MDLNFSYYHGISNHQAKVCNYLAYSFQRLLLEIRGAMWTPI